MKNILDKEVNNLVTSILPLIISLIFCAFFPNIVDFLGYNGIFVCAMNGFVFPILIKIKILKPEKIKERILLWIELGFIVSLNIGCFFALIFNNPKTDN